MCYENEYAIDIYESPNELNILMLSLVIDIVSMER